MHKSVKVVFTSYVISNYGCKFWTIVVVESDYSLLQFFSSVVEWL